MNSKNGPEGMRDSKTTKSVPLSKELQNHIGSKLRAVYGQLVQEPVPERFSELFKQRERVTFEAYVRQLRIQRAKELLSTTDLRTERIAQLSGFALRPYFHRVFKKVVGSTPAQYRRTSGG
jgi:methylphosphotriester-DNA--protein-cysteine methyltransferase